MATFHSQVRNDRTKQNYIKKICLQRVLKMNIFLKNNLK